MSQKAVDRWQPSHGRKATVFRDDNHRRNSLPDHGLRDDAGVRDRGHSLLSDAVRLENWGTPSPGGRHRSDIPSPSLILESTASFGIQGRPIAAIELVRSRCRAHESGRHSAARYLPRARVRRTVPGTLPSRNSSARDPAGPRLAHPVDADAPPTSARQVSGATPRLANARVNSSLNAERREYCCRRSATHFESSASRLVGANARHEATRRAAWP